MKKVLLYSGGMDSWLIDKIWKPDVRLFFNIGTANNKHELDVIKRSGVDVKIIDMDLSHLEIPSENFYLPLRNLYFVAMASNYGNLIALGATASSTHLDKTEEFCEMTSSLINYLLSEKPHLFEPVKVIIPFKDVTKTQLLRKYINEGGDIETAYRETFSCYNPVKGEPCMNCSSCMSKFVAFYNNGYKFDREDIFKFIEFVRMRKDKCKDDVIELYNKFKTGKTIAIDFDGTITEDTPYPITGAIRDGCFQALETMHRLGNRLILNTCRTGDDYEEAVNICKEAGLPLEYVDIKGKVRADYYIDNKNLGAPPVNWYEIEEMFLRVI